VVDILLPGMDGREVIRRLRRNRRTGRCAVVVCSILDPADLADVDADGVLAKPFGKSALAQVVTNATGQGAP
jgi:CheY-like chemotaxis protein